MAELGEAQKTLFEAVPEDGSAIGNTALIRKLKLSTEDYWSIRDALLQ